MTCVYAAKDESTGYIKIGFSSNVMYRVKDLKLTLLSFAPGDRAVERNLHEHLAEHAVLGYGNEVFHPTPEVLRMATEIIPSVREASQWDALLDPPRYIVGTWVRALREAADYSIEEVASKAGITGERLCELEASPGIPEDDAEAIAAVIESLASNREDRYEALRYTPIYTNAH